VRRGHYELGSDADRNTVSAHLAHFRKRNGTVARTTIRSRGRVRRRPS
jgi:hypothetical protein